MNDNDTNDYNTDTEVQDVLSYEIIEDSSIKVKTKLYSSAKISPQSPAHRP